MKQIVKKTLTMTLAAVCLFVGFGCAVERNDPSVGTGNVTAALYEAETGSTDYRNDDDGKLRIDEQHTIDFYLDNESLITEQCLAVIGDRKPDTVETNLRGIDVTEDDWMETFQINGVRITLLHYVVHYTEKPQQYTLLWSIDLDEGHVLASGIRIGSTEEELKRAYEGKTDGRLWLAEWFSDENTREYILFGDWYERYLIFIEVDAKTGIICGISYDYDS